MLLKTNDHITPPVEQKTGRALQPITCFGVTYRSRRALARAYGIPQRTLHSRLVDGMTPEEAVMMALETIRPKGR